MSEAGRNLVVQEIARHQSRIRAFVRCLLVRPSDVDDVLQDINSVLWRKADEFQPGTDFWAWASQIARFKVLNQVRKYGRERLVFDEGMLEQLAAVAEQRLHDFDRRREALDHCLKQLPPAQRQLVDLRYAMQEQLHRFGWAEVEVIDEDLGRSASGSVMRTGFEKMIAEVCLGDVGAVAAREVSRFARNSREWQKLVEVCRMVDTLLIDQETVYHPRRSNDRLLLGLKGSLNE